MFMTVYTWLTDQNRATPTTHGQGVESERMKVCGARHGISKQPFNYIKKLMRDPVRKRQRQPQKKQRHRAGSDPNYSGYFHW